MLSVKGKQLLSKWKRLTPVQFLQLVSVFLSALSLSNAFSSTSSIVRYSKTTITRTRIQLKNINYENAKIDRRSRIGQSTVSFLSSIQQQQYKVAIKGTAFQLFGSSKNLKEESIDVDNDDEDDTEDDDEDDFIVTPNQIKTLRKEADKRRANGRLVSYLLPIHETSRINNYDDDTLYSIGDLFTNSDSNMINELVEVRGICSSYSTTGSKASTTTSTTTTSSSTIEPTKTNRVVDRRHIVSAADEIAIDVATVALNKPVIVVEVRGHRAILYSPALYWDDDDDDDDDGATDASQTQQQQQQQQQQQTILLRSSYRKNQWKKRPRAVRDSKGQIVTDENGNIIRR